VWEVDIVRVVFKFSGLGVRWVNSVNKSIAGDGYYASE